MRKTALIVVGIACLVIGAITAPTPLPTGVPLLAIGIVLLVTISATARVYVRRLRAYSGPVDRGFAFVETRAARPMSTVLRRTRPLARKIEAKAAMKAASAALQSVRARKERASAPGPGEGVQVQPPD
ncbi:hypothetical protein DLJ53_23840 [Acuticoccus sediminis]|uniref:Uncharacterized protein n=1 Tax=Acuticoccus sediminis TaxID=2184697 RepID=A0A8B2NRB8_9HYPH|nr:hypothetical protein [Acuticoccus sediminis]RAH99543.1 hypothetical protein DLJ53_23840 [Acuticoccus sediminis]